MATGVDRRRHETIEAGILEAMPIPVSYLDSDLVFVQANEEVAKALGFEKEDIVGHRLDEVVGKDSEAYRSVEGVVRTGEPYQRLLSFAPFGHPEEHRFYYVSHKPDKDAQGRVRGVFAAGYDVTEHILATERECAQLAAVLETLAEGVVIFDAEGRTVNLNASARRLFGHAGQVCDDAVRWPCAELRNVEGEPIPTEERPFERAMRGERFADLVADFDDPETGERVVFIYSGSCVRDDGLVRVVLTARDITARRRAEEAGEAERLRLRRLIDVLPVAVAVTDAKGRIVERNDMGRDLWNGFAQAREDDPGRSGGPRGSWPRTGRRLKPEDWTLARALRARQSILREEIDVERLDGSRAAILSSAVPIEGAGGKPLGAVGVMEDITRVWEGRRLSEALNALDEAIHSTRDQDRILRRAVIDAVIALDADAAAIEMSEDGGWSVRYVEGLPSDAVGRALTRDAGISRAAAETRQCVVVTDAASEAGMGAVAAMYGARSLIAMPLTVLGEVAGVLILMRHGQPREFDDLQVDFARKLGNSLSIGLENARLYVMAQEAAKTAEDELAAVNRLAKAEKTMREIIRAMARAVEIRDPYTSGHQERVAKLAKSIATEMGLPDEDIAAVEMAGMVHDIGKLHVPSEVLSSPAALSDLEFGIVKTHPEKGNEILKTISFPWPIAEIVLQHHERMDGSGYPNGLAGEEILMPARILAVADVVEAMASHRPYRPSLGLDAAIAELSENDGIYDPEVVKVCLDLCREGRLDL